MINKKELIQQFILLLESDLKSAIESQKNTVEYVTDEDNKPENEYDTRGLEASYLARGQAERVADLKESLAFFKITEIKLYTKDTPIGNSALVCVQDLEQNDDVKNILLMPKGGGLQLTYLNKHYQTVTASSPLGKALLGKKCDEEISYHVGSHLKEFSILNVQ
jgi:Transcription elongation factor, GreA/GreB, C-term